MVKPTAILVRILALLLLAQWGLVPAHCLAHAVGGHAEGIEVCGPGGLRTIALDGDREGGRGPNDDAGHCPICPPPQAAAPTALVGLPSNQAWVAASLSPAPTANVSPTLRSSPQQPRAPPAA